MYLNRRVRITFKLLVVCSPMDLFCFIVVFSLLIEYGTAKPSMIFNVLNYGAAGDGKTDDSKAFLKAWGALVEAKTEFPVLEVPSNKRFLLQSVTFKGPSNSKNVHISVSGNIVAPDRPSYRGDKSNWIHFLEVDGLTIDGPGKIDGRGDSWWDANVKCQSYKGCARPTTILFHGCDNLQLRGLTFVNSPLNHVSISSVNGAIISNIRIIAPKDSPNTDGINISGSSQIKLEDSFIGTGDDCIAINGESSFINITNVACGPGHGISVGSLGEEGAHETVEEVHVQNCNLTRTKNGIRIKTWQGGSGYAKKITFKNIRLIEVNNPVIIDQYYCPNGKCKPRAGNVQVRDVKYIGVHGTSLKPVAISLNCSDSVPCTNIQMNDVQIDSVDPAVKTTATCRNAYGSSDSTTPYVACLD